MAESAETTRPVALYSERAELSERSWGELVERGLPEQVYRFGCLMGRRRGRAIRVFCFPMLEAGVSVAGVAFPMEDQDALVLDPRLLGHPRALSSVVARELARTSYPGWSELSPADEDKVQEFVSLLVPLVMSRSPADTVEVDTIVGLAMDLVEAATDQHALSPKYGPWRCSTRDHQPTTIA